MSSIFQILLKENIWKILKNVFFTLFIQSIVVFLFLCPQFPDSKGKTKKGIFVSISCNSKRLVTIPRYFCFPKFCPWKVTECKGENHVTFFMVSFKNNLFSKISYMHWLFWAIHQIKKAYGTTSYCRFSSYLFHKNVSYQIPY